MENALHEFRYMSVTFPSATTSVSIIESHEIFQVRFAFREAMFAISQHIFIVRVLYNNFQEDLIHDLTETEDFLFCACGGYLAAEMLQLKHTETILIREVL